MGHVCGALTSRGFATWNLEYRRVGNPGGGWPGTFEDVRDGYRLITQVAKERNLDAELTLLMGHSAGGHLALCLAAHEPKVTRVLSLAGVVDLQRAWDMHLSDDAVVGLLGGTPKSVPDHFAEADPMQLSITHAVQWLVQGTTDVDIAPELSKLYFEEKKRRGEDVHLLEIKGADHFDIVDPSSTAWKQIEEIAIKMLS
jgi:acetyl esterase/lipase